jgi:hypothetical protein
VKEKYEMDGTSIVKTRMNYIIFGRKPPKGRVQLGDYE